MHVPASPRVVGRALLLLLGAGLPSRALATGYAVFADGSGHFPTIQAAIDGAQDGDTITVGPGTWSEPLDLGTRRLTIQSSDGAASTILDGTGTDATLTIGSAASLSGFTVRNVGARGAVIQNASPTLTDMVFEDLGEATLNGGAVYILGASPTFTGCTFTGGVGSVGGLVYVYSGGATFNDSELSGGLAAYGGAIAVNTGEVVLVDTSLYDNEVSVHGGAVYVASGATLDLTGVTFTENVNSTGTTYGYGGAVYLGSYAVLAGDDVTFAGNGSPDYASTVAYGGGLFLDTGSLATLTNVTFTDNIAYYGGGVFQNTASRLDVTTAELGGNYAYYGGAIWVSSGDRLALAAADFDANTSVYSGAGLYLYYANDVTFAGSTFTDNLAYAGYGAVAYAYYTTHIGLSDSTVDGNTAYYGGGALYLYSVVSVDFAGVTFTDNSATTGDGGAVYALGVPALTVTDSVFEANASFYGGGGLYTAGGLDLSGSRFVENVAETRSGGGLFVDAAEAYAVTITDTRFEDNTAGGDGGGAVVVNAATLELSTSVLVDNTAGNAGGALYVDGGASRMVRNNQFAANTGQYGGAFYVSGPATPDVWANNVVQDNEASAGGGACFMETTATALTNNVLVGNSASADGAALYLYDAVLDARSVVFAYNAGAAAVFAWDLPTGLTFAYDDWYGNGGGNFSGELADTSLDATHLTDEPGFVTWTANGAADDVFVLWRSSALVDAGDPFVRDADGSASDIGLYSGTYAPLDDADGDGVPGASDCDDADASVVPGAADAWYDGVDQDCEGNSDFDQDRDGQDAIAYGGEDCDDTDFGVTGPCDTGGPGTDGEDTAGDTDPLPAPDPVEEAPTGCGCASGGGRPLPFGALGALGVALVLARRGRRSG